MTSTRQDKLHYDPNPDRTYDLPRSTQVRAVMTMLAHGAEDLVPMLFGPPATRPISNVAAPRGYGYCPGCGRHIWLLRGRCRQTACREDA